MLGVPYSRKTPYTTTCRHVECSCTCCPAGLDEPQRHSTAAVVQTGDCKKAKQSRNPQQWKSLPAGGTIEAACIQDVVMGVEDVHVLFFIFEPMPVSDCRR